jgi:spectinomycin phosphotransferase
VGIIPGVRTEARIDRDALAAFVAARYDAQIGSLEFVPVGVDSWAYAVRDRVGRPRLFLKLFAGETSYVGLPRGAEFPLLLALGEPGRVTVPRPVPGRDGAYLGTFDRFAVCAYEYIEGRSLKAETVWADTLYARVADTLAAIHASTDSVRDLVPRTERYELPFVEPLLETVGRLEVGRSGDAGDVLREVLVSHADEVRTAVQHMEQGRDVIRGRAREPVLCHIDFIGSNLMLGDDGELSVVDWDGAMLGPPEADLFVFAAPSFYPSDRFGWFLERYQRAGGRTDIDGDALAFYLRRRHLEDLAGFVDNVVVGNSDEMTIEESLELVRWIVEDLPALERRIDATTGAR